MIYFQPSTLQLRVKLDKQVLDALLPSFNPFHPFHPFGHPAVLLRLFLRLFRSRNTPHLLLQVWRR